MKPRSKQRRAKRERAQSLRDAKMTAPDPLTEAAWFGFIRWAIGHPEIRARFQTETGLSLDSLDRRSPIEAMVDKATGYRDDAIGRFVEWATREIWGLEDAPLAYQQEIAAKESA